VRQRWGGLKKVSKKKTKPQSRQQKIKVIALEGKKGGGKKQKSKKNTKKRPELKRGASKRGGILEKHKA